MGTIKHSMLAQCCLYALAALVTVSMVALGWPSSASAQITQFPIPTPGSQPNGITAGPDGALWFTETAGSKIGRITTTGAITEFPVPTPGPLSLGGITAGPDGALWFAEVVTPPPTPGSGRSQPLARSRNSRSRAVTPQQEASRPDRMGRCGSPKSSPPSPSAGSGRSQPLARSRNSRRSRRVSLP